MKPLLTADEMRHWDAHTITETGIPSCVLMERASLAIAHETVKLIKEKGISSPRILAVCGTGNNGGDGVCAARILYARGYDCRLFFVGNESHRTDDIKMQISIAEKMGIPVINETDFRGFDLLIDAVFGNGLSREITRNLEVFEAMDASKALIVSADIPSGISADTGHIMGRAVRADVTVTMQSAKIGQLLYPGREYCGKLVTADIGILPLPDQQHAFYLTDEDLSFIPSRPVRSNKGTFGKLLIVAGSENMAGAAFLSASAALSSGVGMVMILTEECNRTILQTLIPEAILKTYKDPDEAVSALREALNWADAVTAGPGIGKGTAARKMIDYLLRCQDRTLILDADGLNCLEGNTKYLADYKGNLLITPHPGEMSRLTGKSISQILDDLPGSAKELAQKCGISVLLKDAATCIAQADGSFYVNRTGNSGMATAGSGDVLSGIAGALAAQKTDFEVLGALAAYLHGSAGDAAAGDKGEAGMTARDIISCLPGILKERKK